MNVTTAYILSKSGKVYIYVYREYNDTNSTTSSLDRLKILISERVSERMFSIIFTYLHVVPLEIV